MKTTYLVVTVKHDDVNPEIDVPALFEAVYPKIPFDTLFITEPKRCVMSSATDVFVFGVTFPEGSESSGAIVYPQSASLLGGILKLNHSIYNSISSADFSKALDKWVVKCEFNHVAMSALDMLPKFEDEV